VLSAAHVDSVTSRLVRDAGCGIVVRPDDPAALVEGAFALRANSPLRRTMGTNGRRYVEKNYNKARVLAGYDQFFQSFTHTATARATAAGAG
jgi:colanic acid biosynthesis glycosyl transferase WcaI